MKPRFTSLVGATLLACVLSSSAFAQSAVIIDQITPLLSGSTTLGGSALSQYYSTTTPYMWDGAVVDNFNLAGATKITNVSALVGMVNPVTPVTNWQVNIYSSLTAASASLIGDIASVLIAPGNASYTTGAPLFHGVAQNGVLSLPVDFDLSAGTFYVSVIGVADYAGGGYRIYTSNGAGGQDAFNTNPGQGNPGISSYAMSGDATYSVSGVSAIPEPSTYAAIFGVATLGLAVWQRRNKTAAVVAPVVA